MEDNKSSIVAEEDNVKKVDNDSVDKNDAIIELLTELKQEQAKHNKIIKSLLAFIALLLIPITLIIIIFACYS